MPAGWAPRRQTGWLAGQPAAAGGAGAAAAEPKPAEGQPAGSLNALRQSSESFLGHATV